ncbi:hypothetical protein PAXRUDRAFT_829227 [Paxillus rubicundulus Ve08.2h10]|uniref:Uncharacterized protein n=1 Tax=Paxillus rubicundulus Ve08.2h10 TaxID=930991 RepID=A0A0D0D880_9AGAM|nr:hypothetical protein PAXRUDRAFT_829227 [Paxillus rubicundulus Ve08.2h10]
MASKYSCESFEQELPSRTILWSHTDILPLITTPVPCHHGPLCYDWHLHINYSGGFR